MKPYEVLARHIACILQEAFKKDNMEDYKNTEILEPLGVDEMPNGATVCNSTQTQCQSTPVPGSHQI